MRQENVQNALQKQVPEAEKPVDEAAVVDRSAPDHAHAMEMPQESAAREERVRSLMRSGRPRRSFGTIVVRRCVSLMLSLVLVLCAGAGLLYWRLSGEPMSMPFITQTVRDAIAAKMPPGYRINIANVTLERRDSGMTATISGVTILDNTAEVASAPRIVIGLDTASLLAGTVAPRSIVVEGAAATAYVSRDGKFTLRPGVQTAEQPVGEALSPVAVINALDAVIASAGSVDTIELKDATLAIHDQALGHDITHRNIDLTIRRTAMAGGLSVALAAGGGTVNATIAGTGDDPRTIDVKASNLILRELVRTFAPGAEEVEITASFDVLARASIDADGTLEMAQADVTSKGGVWTLDPKADPFVYDSAGISLHWDKQARLVRLDSAMVKAGEGIIDFKGTIAPPSAEGAQVWTYHLAAPNVLLAGRRAEQPPLKVDLISAEGHYDPATNRLSLDKGGAVGPTIAMDFTGNVVFGGKTPAIGLQLNAKALPAVAMTRVWPVFALPLAKAWMEDHIKGGVLDGASLTLTIPRDALVAVNGKTPPLPDEAMHGEATISQGNVQVIDTLPPASDVEAKVTFSGRRLNVAVDSASVDTGDGDELSIEKGSYTIPDFAPKPPEQIVSFSVNGPSRAVAKLLTQPPLSDAVKGVAIDPNGVGGTADLDVKLDMPLEDHPQPSEVHYSVTGGVEDMSMDHVSGGKLENGTMKLSIEPGLVLLTGKAVFGGLPATIDMRKAADHEAQMALNVTLDDATRKKKGIDFGDALSGPIVADIRPTDNVSDPRYDIDLDLTAARIKDLLPGWQKPAGKPARASFTWDPADRGGGGTVEDIVVDNGPVSLRGSVALTADNKLRKAVMSTIRLSPGDNFQGSFEPAANGWKVYIRGDQLDARPLLASLQKRAKTSSANAGLSADIKIDKIIGFNDETLSNFSLALESKGTTIRKLDLKGTSDSGGQLTADVNTASDGSNVIDAQSTDAGAVMRFLDYYTHLKSGSLSARVTPVIDNMRGNLIMRDFAVENEPALGQYRTTLRNSGKASADLAVNSNSAQFTRLQLSFTRTASRIGILDSVVWGPDVGVSLSGDIDYGADRVGLIGTFVPAYALNNIFGKIPILGEILAGGKYGGVFAINFKVAGKASAPVLTVNPLSAIAPGFLRKIFEFQKQTD
ncbi:DUF3971 domain-containing protein [Labrys okinawensis]|uniref:YhdP family protein n=1 Tax=Labrys okinawensis TaxID=346911 RepID=UPI0039BC2A80